MCRGRDAGVAPVARDSFCFISRRRGQNPRVHVDVCNPSRAQMVSASEDHVTHRGLSFWNLKIQESKSFIKFQRQQNKQNHNGKIFTIMI